MKETLKILLKTVFLLTVMLLAVSSKKVTAKQADCTEIDLQRMKDVCNIAILVEKFYKKTGYYPLSKIPQHNMIQVSLSDDPQHMHPGAIQRSVFIEELQSILGKNIQVPTDPQKTFQPFPRVYQYAFDGKDYYVSAFLSTPAANTQALNFKSGIAYKFQISSTENKRLAILQYDKFANGDYSDPDAQMLDKLRAAGVTLTKPHTLRFLFYFLSQEDAQEVTSKLKDGGFETELQHFESVEDKHRVWECYASKELIPELLSLTKIRLAFESMVRSFNGEYQGWQLADNDTIEDSGYRTHAEDGLFPAGELNPLD